MCNVFLEMSYVPVAHFYVLSRLCGVAHAARRLWQEVRLLGSHASLEHLRDFHAFPEQPEVGTSLIHISKLDLRSSKRETARRRNAPEPQDLLSFSTLKPKGPESPEPSILPP